MNDFWVHHIEKIRVAIYINIFTALAYVRTTWEEKHHRLLIVNRSAKETTLNEQIAINAMDEQIYYFMFT